MIGSTKGKGWVLGQDWDGNSVTDLFKGEIDEVAIYNRDLTPNEVGYLYSSKSTINTTYYPEIGRLKTRSINSGANSFVTKFNYLNGINGATTTKVGSIDNNGKNIAYTYDPNGNIKTITENNKKITYSYNELNELIREDNQILNKTIVYSYDAGGNIQSKVEYPYTDPSTAPSGTATTVSYTYGDTNWKDKLTKFNGKAITYDAIGNPLTYDGYTYTWEWGRRLASMTGNGKTINYKYNDSGIRTQKTVNNITTNYHLVGDKVTYEDNGTDKIYYTYDSLGSLVSMNLNGVEYYYIRNAQNDIIGLFDNNGKQIASYTYDSWGKLISIKDGNNADITLVDIISVFASLVSFVKNPSWSTFGYLAWDVGAVVAPGLPGSYIAKGAEKVSETLHFAKKASSSASAVSKGTSKTSEIVLPKMKSYEQARNKSFDIMGDLGYNSKPLYGRMGASKGNGKIIGRQSVDGKLRWRLDYDPIKGTHINIEDFRSGKGIGSNKYAIPFEGDEGTFISLLKPLNR